MAKSIEENKAVQLIEEFLQKYPDAEWGCGHVVLSDYNLDDDFIQAAIERGKKFLAGELPEMDYHREDTIKTIAFLEHLLTIPEDERIVDFYGDE